MSGKEVADYLREVGDNLESIKGALDTVYAHLVDVIANEPSVISSTKYARAVVKLMDNESIFKYYSHFCTDISNINSFYNSAKSLNMVYGTYVGSSRSKYVSEEYIKKYHEVIDSVPPLIDAKTVAVFLSNYVTVTGPDDIVNLNKIYLQHKNTIELYCTLLDYYINTEYQKQIISLVEELKIQILAAGGGTIKKPNKSNGVQLLLSSYNLVPVLEALTLPEVLNKLFSIKTKENDVQVIGSILEKSQKKEKSKTGLIIINNILHDNKTTTSTTYNNISDIIDPKYKKTPKTEGVSMTILNRTNNIKVFPVQDTAIGTFGTYNKFVEDADNFHIIDTIDGKHFRILQMWRSGGPVPKIMIPPPHPPEKISYYNKIIMDEILKNVQKPLIMSESRADKKQAIIEYKIIRNSVKKIIIANFTKLLGKSQSVTSDRFLTLISSPQIYSTALMYIAELLSQQYLPNSGSSETDTFRVDELKMSAISDINYMKVNIIRKNATDYKKIAQKMVKNPTDVFSKILDSSLSYYINDKSNIFSTLDSKEGI
jgi:hypothetical protein